MKVKNITTSIKVTEPINKKISEQVVRDGYGMRGKSRWIVEAIENFLELENFPELVDIAADMEQLSAFVSIRIPEDVRDKIDEAVVVVREKHPTLEGVRSNIIRASILQRMIISN